MTPQFIRNLHVIGEMSLTAWFGCIAAVIILVFLGWMCYRQMNRSLVLGRVDMLSTLGLLGCMAGVVLPAMMAFFKVWAFFYFDKEVTLSPETIHILTIMNEMPLLTSWGWLAFLIGGGYSFYKLFRSLLRTTSPKIIAQVVGCQIGVIFVAVSAYMVITRIGAFIYFS